MTSSANINPVVQADNVVYANAVVMPTANADTDIGSPVVVPPWVDAVEAVVEFTVSGSPGSNSTFLVVQGDWGDGSWVDLAWCKSVVTSGTDVFLLSAVSSAGLGVNQSRTAGAAPGSTGQNAGPLPPRFRVAGRSQLSGGSSPKVVANVSYRFRGLR
jgi:hypothetical protein